MSEQKDWVDFKEIKKVVSMEMVLRHYELFDSLKWSGQNLVGYCPIHKGSNPRQFSVNLKRNIFNCFGSCKSGGNVLDFVAKMEGVSIREAALLLQEWFLSDSLELSDAEIAENKEKPAHEENEDLNQIFGESPPLSGALFE